MDKTIPHRSLILALEAAGSQSALGRIVGKTQQGVSYWLKAGSPLSGDDCVRVEKATGVSRRVLRPDLFEEGANQ